MREYPDGCAVVFGATGGIGRAIVVSMGKLGADVITVYRSRSEAAEEICEELRGLGKDVDYLVFKDEGHDVLKLSNRVRCYDAIVGFFSERLG